MEYAIAAHTWANMEKKLDRIARKCERYGYDFVVEVKGEEVRRVYNAKNERYYNVRFVIVEVEGSCKCGDWQAVAQLDMRSSGNVIRMIDTDVAIPEGFRHSENICDHCGTARPRKNLYVIRNNETGEYKQVGSTCLKDYCGLEMLESNDGICEGSYTDWKRCESVKRVIAVACVVTDAIGYRNSNCDGLTTKNAVSTIVFGAGYKGLQEFHGIALDEKAEENEEIKTRAKEIIEHYENMDTASDFIHNVKTIIADGVVEYKDLGYLCYLPAGYVKDVEKKERIEAEAKRNTYVEYFGEVGNRYKNISVKNVRCATSWGNEFGIVYLYQIEIEGAMLVWKTTKELDTDEINSITFTVKKHNEYRNMKQTEVTRCRVA